MPIFRRLENFDDSNEWEDSQLEGFTEREGTRSVHLGGLTDVFHWRTLRAFGGWYGDRDFQEAIPEIDRKVGILKSHFYGSGRFSYMNHYRDNE